MRGIIVSNGSERSKFTLGCAFFAVVCSLFLICSTGSADEPSSGEASQDFSYRRVFVPADSPEKWPVDSKRYVPISRAEFSRLIEQATSGHQLNRAIEVHLTNAKYSANLTRDNLLEGSADIEVHLSSKTPRVLPIAPLNLVVTSTFWQHEPSVPVNMALWNRGSGRSNEMGIYVERSGTLHLDWQLRAIETSGDDLEYTFKIPLITPQIFSLTLPSHQTASLTTGELVTAEELSNDQKKWVFQLGPSLEHRLRISQAQAPLAESRLLSASKVSAYRIEPQGLSQTTQFRLDARDRQIEEELRFSLSDGMRILAVTIDREEVDWRTEKTDTGTELSLITTASTTPRMIEIHSLSRIQFNKPWQLPTVRLLQSTWTEGASSIRVSPRLELLSLIPLHASLEHIDGLDAVASDESYHLQEWTENATCEVIIGKQAAKVRARTATILDLDPTDVDDTDTLKLFEINSNDTTARFLSVLSCQDRPIYQLEGEVSPGWSIEAIKTSPVNALSEWHVYQKDDRNLFRIQLDRPLDPGKQLQIECDFRATKEGSLLPATAKELIPMRFTSIQQTRQLLLLRSQKRGQLELPQSLDSARLQIDSLATEDAALLPETTDGALIDLERLPENAPIRLLPRSAQYRAEVNVEVSVLPDTLAHQYQMDFTPTSGIVSELVVGFDEPLPDSTQWEVPGQSGTIVAQRIDQTANGSTVPDQEIRYQIRLPVALEQPFRLQATYTTPDADTQRCNLIHLPEAVNWQGQLVVRGPLDGTQLDDNGWTTIAREADRSSTLSFLPVIGSYRLGSDRAKIDSIASTLKITRNRDNPSTPSLVVWLADIQSSLSGDGTMIYVATYYLENSGATGAEFELPSQAELQDTWLNQQQLDPREVLADGRCRFHFADDRRYPTITIQYVIRGNTLGHSNELQPELPSCLYPIELGRWTLWTPEHFVIGNFNNGQTTSPLNWLTRLLGPLSRPIGEGNFNPLRAEDWRQLWSTRVDQHSTRPFAERISQKLAELFEGDEEQRWGNILYVMDRETNGEKLYVDRSAFEALGIQAESRLSETTQFVNNSDNTLATTTTSMTVSPLKRFGLSIITTPSLTILTSQDRTSQWRDQLGPTNTPNVYRVSSKSLATRLKGISAGQGGVANGELELVDVRTWTAFPKLPESPWRTPAVSLVSDIGRRAATLEFAKTPPAVVVQREFGQRAQWYAIWLLALVISCRQLARYPRYLALAIALSAAACLIVPSNWLTVPQAIFLGLLSSVLLLVFLPMTAPATKQRSSFRLTKRTAITSLFIGASLISGIVFAETTTSTEQNTSQGESLENPRVLIPIDADGNTQDDDIYLPDAFLHALLRNQGDVDHDGTQCVIKSVQYRGMLPVASSATASNDEIWSILLELENFVENGQLFLPFRHDEAEWISSAHRLNGFPVELHWLENGTGFMVDLNTIGNYRLELSARPKFSPSSNGSKILFHTPAVPGAKLTLTSPSGFLDLSIPTAGHLDIDQTKNRLQTILSGSDILEVSWSASLASSVESQLLGSVDQLTWLQVEPTAARFEVQLHLHPKNTESRRFLLVTSPDLKLIPPKNNSLIETAKYLPDQKHTLEITLKQNFEEEMLIPIQFQLQRTVSVGRINYPWIQIPGFTLNRSLFAVSVRAGLSYDESLRSDAISTQASDFLTEWKADQEPPLFAYALGRGRLDGSLHIWPDPQKLAAQQSMKVHCQLTKTLVTYEASINEVGGRWLIYRLRIPEQLQIAEVVVQQQPLLTTVPARWHRVSDSQVVVMLSQPLREPHLLTLQGHINTPSNGKITVPNISLIEANDAEMQMELSREPEVLVDWDDTNHVPEKIQLNISRGFTANLVGKYVWRDSAASSLSKLQIKKNNRQFDADMVTTLSPGTNGWTGTAHVKVKVREGMLDKLTFKIPDTFQQPYQIEPTSLGSVSEQLDTHGRRLVTVQLPKPLEKDQELSFHLTGSIQLPADQRLTVPDLQLSDASRVNRYVLLPRQVDEKSINWDWAGLSPESLPGELGMLLEYQQNTRAFRIVQEQFSAREKSYQGTLQNAIWRHTFINGVLDHHGNFSATAELVMQPGRATHCTLQLPPNAKLIQLATGDSRVRREKTEDGNWRIPLGPPYLPRRITASYQTQVKVSEGRFELQSPLLLIDERPLPSPETRWKIHPVGRLRLADPIVGRPLTPEQFSRAALKLSLHTIADARLLALELPTREGRVWFKSWQRRTQQSWEEWRILEPDSETLEALSSTAFGSNYIESDIEESAWTTLLEQLGDPNSNLEHSNQTMAYQPLLPGQTSTSETSSEKFFLSGTQEHLALSSQPASQGDGWRWFFAVLIVSGSVILTRQLEATTDWATLLRNQTSRLLIAIGLVWWLLLTPSVLGLLLVAGALLSKVIRQAKRAWRRQLKNTSSQIIQVIN